MNIFWAGARPQRSQGHKNLRSLFQDWTHSAKTCQKKKITASSFFFSLRVSIYREQCGHSTPDRYLISCRHFIWESPLSFNYEAQFRNKTQEQCSLAEQLWEDSIFLLHLTKTLRELTQRTHKLLCTSIWNISPKMEMISFKKGDWCDIFYDEKQYKSQWGRLYMSLYYLQHWNVHLEKYLLYKVWICGMFSIFYCLNVVFTSLMLLSRK